MTVRQGEWITLLLIGVTVAVLAAAVAGAWYTAGAVYRAIDPGPCDEGGALTSLARIIAEAA